MGSPARIEYRASRDRMMLEACHDAGAAELIKNIPLVAPVLQALEVVVKAVADVGVPFAHDGTPPLLAARSRKKVGGTRPTTVWAYRPLPFDFALL
jgi:hypothetical protein